MNLLELNVNFEGGTFEVYSLNDQYKSGVLFGYQNMRLKLNIMKNGCKTMEF